jgi:hypothetical protein
VATPTLANFRNRPPLFADFGRPAPRIHAKPQPQFRVFPSDQVQFHWRIVALASNRTVSRHNSLGFALKKCTRLNGRREKGSYR